MDSIVYHRSDNLALIPAVRPAAAYTSNGAITAAVIDKQALDREYEDIVAHIVTGAFVGTVTGMTLESKWQHRASTGDSWEDVTDLAKVEAASKSLTDQNKDQTFAARFRNLKRYVKIVPTLTVTGSSTPGVFASVNYSLGRPRNIP